MRSKMCTCGHRKIFHNLNAWCVRSVPAYGKPFKTKLCGCCEYVARQEDWKSLLAARRKM